MINEKAYAKLNLNLHILPHKMINSFYEVRFINTELDLHDDLSFDTIPHEIRIISDNKELPEMHHNLIYKAGILIKELVKALPAGRQGKNLGARVILDKKIPIKAGFGGGSSDAAAAIKGFSKLWDINLDKNKRFQLASRLGCDVHYSLVGGLCEIKGDGSEVYQLKESSPVYWLIIITPQEKKPSTEWMYKNLDLQKIGKNLNKFNNFIHNKTLNNLHNDFEFSVFHFFPGVLKIKKDLEKNGAKKALLAGSGLSMVGFYETQNARDKAFKSLSKIYNNIISTKTR